MSRRVKRPPSVKQRGKAASYQKVGWKPGLPEIREKPAPDGVSFVDGCDEGAPCAYASVEGGMTRPIRVLLIEDNPGDADLTKETLESGKLHLEIEVASDGAAALEKLVGNSSQPYIPDLVLLDLNLPKLDGRSLLGEMRARTALKHVPVVILSSSDAEQDIVKSYELGANCYVTKPVGLDAFQNIVRSIEDFWFTVVKLP